MNSSGQPVSGFIGRRPEMAVLSEALDDAISGHGRLVMLAGEPGLPDPRLARELVGLAEQRGSHVFWGWCYEQAGAPPYWPWTQAIRSYAEKADPQKLLDELGPGLAEISGILPELTGAIKGQENGAATDLEQARFRLFVAVSDFLSNVGGSQPLVIVLDDLQWADESSLLLLEFLTYRLPTSSILIVGTYRDAEVGGSHPLARTLGGLVREEIFRRVNMSGLTRQEVGDFVAAKAGVSPPDAAVDALHRRTQGNPLYVGEVVGSVSVQQMAQDDGWLDKIPGAVREVIIRRLSRLSESCWQVLRTASVIGRDFDLPLLRSLCAGLTGPDLLDAFLDAFDEALAARVIESSPATARQYRFGHALIQQAVYEEFSPMRRILMHAAAADALEQRYLAGIEAHAGELAHHFAEAVTASGSEKAIKYALIAGERALESFAYEGALHQFSVVLDLNDGQGMDDETAQALFGLGRAQATALPRHELIQAHRNLTRAFEYYVQTGNTAQIVAIGEFPFIALAEHGISTGLLPGRALELVPPDSADAGRLHGIYGRSQGMEHSDYAAAQRSFDQALAIAERDGNPGLEMITLIYAAQVDGWHHHFQLSLERNLRAIELAVGLADLRGEVEARFFAGIAYRTLGDIGGLRFQASAILAPADTLRDRYWLASAYSSLDLCPFFEGDLETARNLNDRGLAQMPMDPRLLLHRIIIEATAGTREETNIYLRKMEEVVEISISSANSSNAALALSAGAASAALGPLERPDPVERSISAVLSSATVTPFFALWSRIGAAFLALANNDLAAIPQNYAELVSSAGYLVVTTSVDRVLGLLSRTAGESDRAIRHFEDALDLCRKGPNRPEIAWVCHDYAGALLQRGAPGDQQTAGLLLDEGLDIAFQSGMISLQEKIAMLRSALPKRPAPAETTAYPGGLTQREVEVLKLICGGMTDREIGEELFISIKTVGNHVSHILNKTGAANRTEAATYAARNGIVERSANDI